jgi:thiamine pyrophosphate-dependent acetolactate synthase large subunit-like protein
MSRPASWTERRSLSGGQWVAEALAHHGVDMVFGVPGESYLAVLDALHDRRNRIRFVTCRQEGGAANMADAYGKLTGRPGVVMVTRGPGATNASIGVHTAFQDSTPMLVLIGQVGRDMRDREAFQEIDYRRFYSEITKWTAEVDDPARVPEYIARAMQIAVNGRPGPVALALPEDMLREIGEASLGAPVARTATPRASPAVACNATVRRVVRLRWLCTSNTIGTGRSQSTSSASFNAGSLPASKRTSTTAPRTAWTCPSGSDCGTVSPPTGH